MVRQGHTVGVITSEKALVEDSFPFKIFRLKKPFSLRKINLNFLEIPGIIKQFQPEIFHINYQTGGENFLIPLLKIMRVPVIITYHADHVITLGKMIDEFQLATTFRCADSIIIQSEREKKKFKSRGIPGKKMALIRFNGIDTKKYKCELSRSWNGNSIRLLCIARLDDSHKYKGIHELIVGIKEVNDSKIPLELSVNIIGDGSLRAYYENERRAYHLDNISFLGNLSFEQMLKEICDTNFLILPSINKAEGFGRVALEALSCGTPVIVSKYAGIAELIEKYDAGIVYDPKEFKKLFFMLVEFVYRHGKIQQLSENGKKLISDEHLSLALVTKKVISIYHKFLASDKRHD